MTVHKKIQSKEQGSW